MEQALEEISPGAVLMELVEDPKLRGGQLATKNAFAMFGDVPVQISGLPAGQVFGESGLADLSWPGDEDHLFGQIAPDLGQEITGERGHPAQSMAIFTFRRNYSRVISP
jgi:hypothetical protein